MSKIENCTENVDMRLQSTIKNDISFHDVNEKGFASSSNLLDDLVEQLAQKNLNRSTAFSNKWKWKLPEKEKATQVQTIPFPTTEQKFSSHSKISKSTKEKLDHEGQQRSVVKSISNIASEVLS